ncbi:MAG TPA: FAD-dependent oxidoreductase [Anaerolineae bacterium]
MEEAKKPTIVAVDDEASSLAMIEQELRKRYGADYEIFCANSPVAALHSLKELREGGNRVAVVLAGCWMAEMDGADFIQRAHKLHPGARRGLLVNWGDRTAAESIQYAMALGIIDAYSPIPWTSGDEAFHHFVTRFLEEWSREHQHQVEVVKVVGERWSRRSHELRDLLERNSIPYGFYDEDSKEGRTLLEQAQWLEEPLPVVILLDGQVLGNPSNTELANALVTSTIYDISGVPEKEVVDVVIIGAGPAGLSTAVYGASEGLWTVVVEREAIGGQAGMSARIRNYLGFPTGISGNELAIRAYQQAWLFGADFTFTQEAIDLETRANERVVVLSDGIKVAGRTVVLAVGVAYRRLQAPGLEDLIGAGVFYGAVGSEATAMKGQEVFVVGGGNSAGQAAVHLAKYANQVTLLVLEDSLSIHMSEYLIREIENSDNIEARLHTVVIEGRGEHRLEWLVLQDTHSGQIETVPAAALFVLIGAVPRTDWLPPTIQRDQQGYILTGQALIRDGNLPSQWPLERPPLLLETSIPGVFAVGDVRHRSVKRVASAVGEGSIAVQLIHQYLSG